MLGNTLTITFNATPIVLTKINQDSYASEYLNKEDPDEEFSARIRHQKSIRAGVTYDRHNFELTQRIYATSSSDEVLRKVYFVIEQNTRDTNIHLPKAAFDLALASSNAFLTSLSKWES